MANSPLSPEKIYARRQLSIAASTQGVPNTNHLADGSSDAAFQEAINKSSKILNSNEAIGREETARLLAGMELSADQAIKILAAAPRSSAAETRATNREIYSRRTAQ